MKRLNISANNDRDSLGRIIGSVPDTQTKALFNKSMDKDLHRRHLSIKCYLLNARSVVNKQPEISTFVEINKPDLLIITETWLHSDIPDSEIKLPGYQLLRMDRENKNGGGCIMYFKDKFVICDYNMADTGGNSQPFVQIVWGTLKIGTYEILLGIFYNSPQSTIEQIARMNDAIGEACRTHKNVLICGDFNFPNIDWDKLHADTRGEGFLQMTLDCFLQQHVQSPTRGNNILDLVLATEGTTIRNVVNCCPLGSSDHNTVKFELEVPTMLPMWKKFYRNYRCGNYTAFKKYLTNIDWNIVFMDKNINDMWENFKNIIHEGVSNFVPLKKRRSNAPAPPWVTKNVISASKDKLRKWKAYKVSKSPEAYESYKRAQQISSKTVRSSKRRLEEQIASNIKTDPKAFYKYMKHKTDNRSEIGALEMDDGTLTKDDQHSAEVLNQYFSTVFTEERTEYTPSPEATDIIEPMKSVSQVIKPALVQGMLRNVNPEKSEGPDEIHPVILRKFANELALPLSDIFRESLRSGEVPKEWKLANVTPIHKKGAKVKPANYRPISLTSQVCRIMERIIKEKMMHHLDSNNLIKPTQHGFLKGRSCLTNLLLYLEKITKSLDDGYPVDAVYLDFTKAFDKVPHKRLLKKLEVNGISLEVQTWIKNWLYQRMQRVLVKGCKSRWAPVTSGVPQGSVLGPVLFLIYINDLEQGIDSAVLKFADDTKVFRVIKSDEDKTALQNDINKIKDWSDQWQMSFNAEKCHVMNIGSQNTVNTYKMGEHQMNSTKSERDLGVIIQRDLDASEQVGKIVKKANQILGLIARVYENRSKKNILPLYKTLVRPHLEYAMQAWRPYKQKDINNIESVQRRATRMIEGLSRFSYEERLRRLNLISLEMRRLRGDLIEVFKIMHGMEGLKPESMFQLAAHSNTRGHTLKIYKQRSRLDCRKFFFSQRIVDEWNALPDKIVTSASVNQFKGGISQFFNAQRSNFRSQRWLPAPILRSSGTI